MSYPVALNPTHQSSHPSILGASLCEKYSSSAKEIVGVLEAQIINSNKGIISLDIMGKVEQQLLQNTQQVLGLYDLLPEL